MFRDYATTLKQIKGVTEGEENLIANLSNIAAILKELPGYFWVGFYLVNGEELIVGPYQGPVACSRIKKGKGVCGYVWDSKSGIVVKDVHEFPGHIACSPISKSEVVVPVFNTHGEVMMVLDVDSAEIADFDEKDKAALEKVANHITELMA